MYTLSSINEVSSAKAVRKRACSAKGGEWLGRREKGQDTSSLADKTLYLFSHWTKDCAYSRFPYSYPFNINFTRTLSICQIDNINVAAHGIFSLSMEYAAAGRLF
jgi:hypothetical protein